MKPLNGHTPSAMEKAVLEATFQPEQERQLKLSIRRFRDTGATQIEAEAEYARALRDEMAPNPVPSVFIQRTRELIAEVYAEEQSSDGQ